jgi:acid phosphatase family membrane protein YuiD
VPRTEIDVHHKNHRYDLALQRVKADRELLPANAMLGYFLGIVRGFLVYVVVKPI